MVALDVKISDLRECLAGLDRVVVCFSGGVDSSYLLAQAVDVLGEGALALTAVSPSLAAEEGEDARHLAEQLGARHVLVETFEVDDPRYAANPTNLYGTQISPERLGQVGRCERVLREFQAAGFVYVAVDLQGYRMGSLKEAVTTRRSPEVTAV